MILGIFTRAQIERLRDGQPDEATVALLDRALSFDAIAPDPDDCLPAAFSLSTDRVVTVTFADSTLADLVWEGLTTERVERPVKKRSKATREEATAR